MSKSTRQPSDTKASTISHSAVLHDNIDIFIQFSRWLGWQRWTALSHMCFQLMPFILNSHCCYCLGHYIIMIQLYVQPFCYSTVATTLVNSWTHPSLWFVQAMNSVERVTLLLGDKILWCCGNDQPLVNISHERRSKGCQYLIIQELTKHYSSYAIFIIYSHPMHKA